MKNKIAVLYGGHSSQYQINRHHGQDIADALSQRNHKVWLFDTTFRKELLRLITDYLDGKFDIVFNNACGKKGGDGSIEGILEAFDIPFVGSDTLATALSFDKKTTKKIVSQVGIPVIDDLIIGREYWKSASGEIKKNIQAKIGFPLVVKASRGTDSIAVTKVDDASELSIAIKRALEEDNHVLVEKYVLPQKEIVCMNLGNGKNLQALKPLEQKYEGEIYDELTKIQREVEVEFLNPKGSLSKKIRDYSLLAHRVIGCRDYSKVDFLVDNKNQVYFLEINAHAGLSRQSPTTIIAKESKNWNYQQTIEGILQIALKREKIK